MHHRNQCCVITKRVFEYLQIQQAILHRVQISYFKTISFELPAGIEHSLVFGFNGDNMLALFLIELCRTFNRQVVGFSGP